MPFLSKETLGPLLRSMCNGASWWNKDDFPSNQIWADEIEKVLSHLDEHNQFQRYLPNLRGKLSQRNGALAEARVSFYFCRNGFSIISWEPHGNSNSLGEFEIQWDSTSPIFVEVKGPTWEGELNETERNSDRRNEGKYKHAETRTLDSIGKIVEAISKATNQKKFAVSRPNLLVIYSTHMFVSPLELNPQIVTPKVSRVLNDFPTLGGVLVFNAICRNITIDYKTLFIENKADNCSSKLPIEVVDRLRCGQV